MLENNEVYKALATVAKSGLLNTPVEDLVMVAIAIWHEGFVPNYSWVKKLDQESQLVVGYMVEFFAGFNVLCGEERKKLLQFSEEFKPHNPAYDKPDDNRDELATEWGLEHDLTLYFEHLSHFQTRHYEHKSSYKRPSPNFVL
jgi:hypothetical protein